jgi:hypothetical protein
MAAPTSAIFDVEAAIKALCTADSTFNTRCPGGMTSDEVELQTYPFVLMDNGLEKPWNTLGGRTVGNGRELTIRLHIYSRYKGDKEVLQILKRLVELLDFAELTVSGYQTVLIEYDGARVLVEDRDKLETRHVPAEFQVRVHE